MPKEKQSRWQWCLLDERLHEGGMTIEKDTWKSIVDCVGVSVGQRGSHGCRVPE